MRKGSEKRGRGVDFTHIYKIHTGDGPEECISSLVIHVLFIFHGFDNGHEVDLRREGAEQKMALGNASSWHTSSLELV